MASSSEQHTLVHIVACLMIKCASHTALSKDGEQQDQSRQCPPARRSCLTRAAQVGAAVWVSTQHLQMTGAFACQEAAFDHRTESMQPGSMGDGEGERTI